MISIVTHKKSKDKMYQYSYYQGDTLISKAGYLNDESVYSNDYAIEIPLEKLYSEKLDELPGNIAFYIEEILDYSLFTISGFKYINGKLEIHFSSYATDDSWKRAVYNPIQIIDKIKGRLGRDFSLLEFYSGDVYQLELACLKDTKNYRTIGDFAGEVLNILRKAEEFAVLELSGFQWKREYETNESLFSKEVVSLLLRKMGFKKVQFCHGNAEYGRDFIFSDLDKFGNYIHFGMQVKAGDISGKVNGQMDELIGQLDDAFKMPFIRNNEPALYISIFYILISGKFTESARHKLRMKIPPEYAGSVQILDKEGVMGLLATYYNSR